MCARFGGGLHNDGRPGHRRSYCQATGAFTSLGALPRRGSTSSIPQQYSTKKPTFHFRQDDHDDDDDDDDDDEPVMPSRLEISTNNVPFPSSSSSPLHSPSVRPPLGKPFKSSLKSSTSSPNIPFPSQSLVPSIMFPDLHPKQQQQQQHQRASSAPSTPLFTSFSSPTHHSSKNVHFPSQDLATIRVFNRSARPDSLGRLGEETETETEGEGSGAGRYIGGSTFPFPQVFEKSPLCQSKQKYQINWSQSSGIPRTNVDRAIENIFFESLHVVEGANDETVLEGTILVRNITYQKTVLVRYTLDDWETVNDVSAWYHLAVPNGWDRFKFSVTLDGSLHGLENRTMWLVGKYAGADQGRGVEWWDNNDGRNYRVGFKKVEEKVYKRGVVVSAPTTPTRPTLQISSSPSFPFLGQQERERTPYQASITQTTLARLKKLNLKNYAAPSGYPYANGKQTTPPLPVLTTASFVDPSPAPASEMSSPTTSTDSTPLQTPTPDGEEDDRLTWSLCLENGHFATTLVPSSSSSSPNRTPIASPIPTYPSSDIEKMGTSPPFGDESVYWDWGSAAGATFSLSGGESSSSSSSGGIMPPQRKRGLQKRESLNGSGNESSPIAPSSSSIPTPTPSTAAIASPPLLKRKPTPPKLSLPTVQSPNARRPSHRRHFQPSVVHSPTPGGGGDSDAIYQALVREWCFAQGPTTTSGEMTPKVQIGADGGANSPGLICTLGDE